MNDLETRVYKWALRQTYQSVAARYSKVLAEYIRRAGVVKIDELIKAAKKNRKENKIMPDNYGRMTSSEAPKKLQDFCYPKQKSQWGKALVEGLQNPSVPYRGEDMIGDTGFGTTEHALKSARDALWTIANMQITENTEKGEVLDLCMSIARIELEKCYTANK